MNELTPLIGFALPAPFSCGKPGWAISLKNRPTPGGKGVLDLGPFPLPPLPDSLALRAVSVGGKGEPPSLKGGGIWVFPENRGKNPRKKNCEPKRSLKKGPENPQKKGPRVLVGLFFSKTAPPPPPPNKKNTPKKNHPTPP
eukprot:FR735459.1.p2 GENE.FR735459.1~~FR735459.1.p2  ORF type:complete len:141 (+),score=81.36 FR735459.1:816-1238(+)